MMTSARFTHAAALLGGLLLSGPGGLAQLVAEVDAGCDKWGYAGDHLAYVQAWNGAPFVLETDVRFPPATLTAPMPRESWFGLYVQDGQGAHRYVAAVFNPAWEARPQQVVPTLIFYEKSGTMQRLSAPDGIPYSAGRAFLRLAYDGTALEFSSSPDGKAFKTVTRLAVPAGFHPDQVGLTADAYHQEGSLKGVGFAAFKITGDGPAKSDAFRPDGTVAWTAPSVRGRFQAPVTLQVQWTPDADSSGVFDFGLAAVLPFSCRTTELAGKTLALEAVCRDATDDVLWRGASTVMLAAAPVAGRIVIPAGTLPKNGVYRLALSASLAGQPLGVPLAQQFAVIPPGRVTPGVFDQRSPYSVNYFSDWRLAARIGARQVRQTYWSLAEFATYVAAARANGLLINGPYLNLGTGDMPADIQKKAEEVAGIFAELKKAYPDVIYAQEIYNEPENWPPTSVNTDLVPFAALAGRVKARLGTLGVPLQVISPGTTHRNLAFLKKLAVIGGADSVDIVAVHGYRSPCRPEFGHEEDVAAIRDLFGANKPIYVDEDAYFASSAEPAGAAPSITLPVSSMIELDELTQGIYLQRLYLCQLAAGYRLVNQFDAIPSHSLSENPFHRRPGIVTYAALTSRLPHPEFKGRRTAMQDSLWALDWESDGIHWLTLWTLNGPEIVELKAPQAMSASDGFANPLGIGKELRVTVGGSPIFVKGTGIEITGRRDGKGQPPPAVLLPEERDTLSAGLAVTFGGGATSMRDAAVWISLRNATGIRKTGELTPAFMNDAPAAWGFTPATARFALEPGAEQRFTFVPGSTVSATPFDPYNPVPGQGYAALWWAEGFRLAARLTLEDGTRAVVHQPRPLCLRGIPYADRITIDGDPGEWRGIPEFKQLGKQKRNVELYGFWTGMADFCPTFRMAWSEQGVLFLAEVIDDKHDATQTGLNAWRTDSVQIGLDSKHETPSFTDYLVLTLATSGPAVLQRATPRLPAGVLPQVQLKTRRVEGDYNTLGRTVYECLIPWSLLRVSPVAGTQLGFAVLFNESDGWWRKGWEGTFVQMGGHLVDPRYFGEVTLVK